MLSLLRSVNLKFYPHLNRYMRKRPKVDASITQRRVENTRVHFWTFSPVSVKVRIKF